MRAGQTREGREGGRGRERWLSLKSSVCSARGGRERRRKGEERVGCLCIQIMSSLEISLTHTWLEGGQLEQQQLKAGKIGMSSSSLLP